jgi:hypothetical protein
MPGVPPTRRTHSDGNQLPHPVFTVVFLHKASCNSHLAVKDGCSAVWWMSKQLDRSELEARRIEDGGLRRRGICSKPTSVMRWQRALAADGRRFYAARTGRPPLLSANDQKRLIAASRGHPFRPSKERAHRLSAFLDVSSLNLAVPLVPPYSLVCPAPDVDYRRGPAERMISRSVRSVSNSAHPGPIDTDMIAFRTPE